MVIQNRSARRLTDKQHDAQQVARETIFLPELYSERLAPIGARNPLSLPAELSTRDCSAVHRVIGNDYAQYICHRFDRLTVQRRVYLTN